jgi:hypothetical protein
MNAARQSAPLIRCQSQTFALAWSRGSPFQEDYERQSRHSAEV